MDNLSAGDTAIRFLPMGVIGFIASLGTGKLLEYMNGKYLLLAGLLLTVLAPIPSALTVTMTDNLYVRHNLICADPANLYVSWINTLATSLISITAVSLIFVTTSTTILTSVPVDVKSLCGGMVSPFTNHEGLLG